MHFYFRHSLEKDESMARIQIELSDKFLNFQREVNQRKLNFEQVQRLFWKRS